MYGQTATVFNIERSSSEDGPGIRTVVFLKGCAMRCKWCANPESQSFRPEVIVNANLCIGCENCLRSCPAGAIRRTAGGVYASDPSRCILCGACIRECYVGARTIAGKEYTPSELTDEVLKDREYFIRSGGGVTFSGGEPLLHAPWIAECANRLHSEGVSVLIETCGFISRQELQLGAEAADMIFYDIKHMDEDAHRSLTGQSNRLILENLRWLNENFRGVLSVRCPVVPGCNDSRENIRAMLDFVDTLDRVREVWFLPYHRLGLPKYLGLGRDYPMGDMPSLKFSDIAYLRDENQKEFRFEIRI